MRTAKKLVEIFSNYNPSEEIFIYWFDKEDIKESVAQSLDNLGEEITADEIVNDSFASHVFNAMEDNDSMYEYVADIYTQIVDEKLSQVLSDIKEDETLWDKEKEDKQLWDTETENTNG